MTIVILSLTACSADQLFTEMRIKKCWEKVSKINDNVRIDDLEFVYLNAYPHGSSILVPAFKCNKLRIQVVSFSSAALKALDKDNYGTPLGTTGRHGSITFEIRDQHVSHVIAVDLVSISIDKVLSGKRSDELLDRIRPRRPDIK